jgi:lysozyme family protein
VSAFDQAWSLIAAAEGDYANDPADPGGETRYGISKRAFPNEDIPHLTPERAQALFRKNYWEPMRCDDLPPGLAIALADAAFNQGTLAATEMLQQALPVKVDGVLGPMTLSLARCAGQRVITRLCRIRIHRYHDLAALRPYQRKFLTGWVERVLRVHAAALRLTEEA